MGILPDCSPFGSRTVTGPGWPNVDEESLASAATQYEALAAKLSGSVVPQQQGQLMQMADTWKGGGALAAGGEATTIIAGHEANAAQAAAIALKLRSMEATVAKTKVLVNATAQEVQHECEVLANMPYGNAQELVQSRIKMGLSQNIAMVNANSAELAAGLGVPPNIPNPGAPPGAPQASQAADKGSQQATQMMMQMGQIAAQLPQQIGGLLTQAPQQLVQPLQQIMQPLQQLMSAGGEGGSGMASSSSPFSSFSNHPLAGGSGAGAGGGMVKAASLPGSGGFSPQSPALASLVGSSGDVSVRPAGAASAAIGGLAPVSAGGGGMGGAMGMMGQRGESGGTGASLAAPAPLDYGDEEVDDDW